MSLSRRESKITQRNSEVTRHGAFNGCREYHDVGQTSEGFVDKQDAHSEKDSFLDVLDQQKESVIYENNNNRQGN